MNSGLVKKLVVISLAALFMFQAFSKLMLIVSYEINREYITKTFCENVNKPTLKCNGKCHLAKELKKEEKKEKLPCNTFKETLEILLFSQDERMVVDPLASFKLQHYSIYLMVPSGARLLSIYHPPCS